MKSLIAALGFALGLAGCLEVATPAPVSCAIIDPGDSGVEVRPDASVVSPSLDSGVLQPTADAAVPFRSTPVTDYTARTLAGWVVHLANDVDAGGVLPVYGFDAGTSINALLLREFEGINAQVPPAALAPLHSVNIWVTLADTSCTGACYHGSEGWLEYFGYDPRKALGIEFTNVSSFVRYSNSQPWAVLHELAHAYHDQVLGTDDPDIERAYLDLVDAGVLLRVKNFDGKRTLIAKHYALNNPAEMFAEMTESFFGRNDFAPFDRAELHAQLPQIERLIAAKWGADAGP